MKFFLMTVLILFLLMFSLSVAQKIVVKIEEVLSIETFNFQYDSLVDKGIFKVSFGVYNTGSVGYKARARLDVFNGSKLIFTGWSEEKSFTPSTRKTFTLYWLPSKRGKFNAEIRIYYANEIKTVKKIKFEVKNVTLPSDVFEIKNLKTFSDEIEFDLISKESLKDVLIIPSDYPLGWIFEQKKIDDLMENEEKEVSIKYEPSLWKSTTLTLNIITSDGEYFTSKSLKLERVSPLEEFFHQLFKLFRELFYP